jgi:hypothetical protein
MRRPARSCPFPAGRIRDSRDGTARQADDTGRATRGPIKVLHQVFLFSRLENHRVEKPWRVGLNVPPTLVIHVEIGSHPPLAVMTRDDLIHKAFKDRLVPANGPKSKRLDPPLASALRVLTAIKPDPERKPAAPEEMASRGGDQRHLRASQRGIEIDATDALQERRFSSRDPAHCL